MLNQALANQSLMVPVQSQEISIDHALGNQLLLLFYFSLETFVKDALSFCES